MTHEAGLWVAEYYKLSTKASPAESEVTGFKHSQYSCVCAVECVYYVVNL